MPEKVITNKMEKRWIKIVLEWIIDNKNNNINNKNLLKFDGKYEKKLQTFLSLPLSLKYKKLFYVNNASLIRNFISGVGDTAVKTIEIF
jgi:hypothetical protein